MLSIDLETENNFKTVITISTKNIKDIPRDFYRVEYVSGFLLVEV